MRLWLKNRFQRLREGGNVSYCSSGLLLLTAVILVFIADDLTELGWSLGLLGLFIPIVLKKSNSRLRSILLFALLLRLIVALTVRYLYPMRLDPYETNGWKLAQSWTEGASVALGRGSRFYASLIGIVYLITGRTPLFIQTFNVILGTLSVWQVYWIANRLWAERPAIIITIVSGFYPFVILYSAVLLPEAPMILFLVTSLRLAIQFWDDGHIFHLLGALLFALVSAKFQTGMLVALTGVLFLAFLKFFYSLRRGGRRQIVLMAGASLLVFSVVAAVFFTGFGFEKIGDHLNSIFDPQYLLCVSAWRSHGRAVYKIIDHGVNCGLSRTNMMKQPTYHPPPYPMELWGKVLLAIPMSMFLVMFSPFPWWISSPVDLIGFFDGFIYFGLVIMVGINVFRIKRHKKRWVALALLGVLLLVIAGFGMFTSNYGTAIRHRAKFIWLLAILAAPVLSRLLDQLGNIVIKSRHKIFNCQSGSTT